MRKITAGLHISLDGVVETPEKWTRSYFNDEMMETMCAGVEQADAVLLGRNTYQIFAAYWPSKGSSFRMASFLNNTPKYVVSSTLNALEWANSSRIAGDLTSELSQLKQKPGKNIQVPGSPTLVRSLLCGGLLDELALFVFPIVVGAGMRLFEEGNCGMRLRLVESKGFRTGVVALTYRAASA